VPFASAGSRLDSRSGQLPFAFVFEHAPSVIESPRATIVSAGAAASTWTSETKSTCVVVFVALPGGTGIVAGAAGTAGTAGPTEAAGALADGGSVERARALGHDPRARLDDNDSNAVLTALGDLVVTGPTNTNLLDLYLLLVAAPGAHRISRN
jgi:hypothetical protein